MKRVHVLHEPNYSQNGVAFLFPLIYHKRRLKDQGVLLRFFSEITPTLTQCDALCVSSRFFRSWWLSPREDEMFAFLREAKKVVGKLFWFDISDSTGTTQFKVLPFVDGYIKNQVLKDRRFYQKHYYGSRIFTDFYHTFLGIEDKDPGPPHLNHLPDDTDLSKIQAGWNSGLFHYGYAGLYLGKLWHRLKWLPVKYPKRWATPSSGRTVPVSCRIGTPYSRETIAESRRKIKELLKDKIPADKISRYAYFQELRDSIAAISPFGLGEISLRDFEITISGAAMIKQDMSHLETWPDLWTADSYLPLAWNFSDFEQKIEYALQHPKDMVELAHNAQERYKKVLCTEQGQEEFCNRFFSMVGLSH